MIQLNPYLTFYGHCREAMNFYKDIMGGELTIQTVGETPMKDQFPVEMHDQVMHSMLKTEGITLMASDVSMGEGIIGNNITLSLTFSNEEELKTTFAKLSEGGKINHPVQPFFAGTMGDAADKYGINWMFYFEKQLTSVDNQ
jgi:PhnB protein